MLTHTRIISSDNNPSAMPDFRAGVSSWSLRISLSPQHSAVLRRGSEPTASFEDLLPWFCEKSVRVCSRPTVFPAQSNQRKPNQTKPNQPTNRHTVRPTDPPNQPNQPTPQPAKPAKPTNPTNPSNQTNPSNLSNLREGHES